MSSRLKYLLIAFLFVASYSFSQSYEKELDQFLNNYYKNKNVPSISAGISFRGKITWLKAEGFSDIENNVPATPKSIYRIASISKSITAVAIMQLYEQKKISLDDDVRKYLPWFPKKKWKFTIRQLLSHTAGIRTYHGDEFDNKLYFRTTKDAINFIAQDSLEFEPGTNFLYTTLGYNLLAGVIESVTGQSYPDYMRVNIFQPCGLTNTNYEYHPQIVPNRAHGYERNSYRILQNSPLADLSVKFAGGGIISTAEDLLRFANGILYGKLIKKSTIDTMLVPVKLKSGRVLNYSLGFTAGIDSEGRRYFTHSGGGTGFTSQLLIYPDKELAAVSLVNMRDRNLENPAYSFVKIILDKEYNIPKISLADRLMNVFLKSGIDSSLIFYNIIKKDSTNFYQVSIDELNYFGQDLIAIYKFSDAIRYYKFVLNDFPEKSTLLIGLGDAYLRDGNKGLALKHFRSVINLDPTNKYASDMVRKLEKQ